MMDATVVGLGLVSPAGLTARDHVFFLRAHGAVAGERAFVDRDGEPLPVLHCPWLDPAILLAPRMLALASQALGDALSPLRARSPNVAVPLVLTLPPHDEAFGEADAGSIEAALAERHGLEPRSREHGEAGFFRALERAAEWLARGDVPAVAVACVDSAVDARVIPARLPRPSPWARAATSLSEAASAVVLARAPIEGSGLGRIRYAGVAMGASNDDNLEPVDGVAMTKLVRDAVSAGEPIRHAFGPRGVDLQRAREWSYAVVRNSERFAPECSDECMEDLVGRVGAASGGLHLVFGLAAMLHGTHRRDGLMAAWAISRDGTRGLSLAEAGP